MVRTNLNSNFVYNCKLYYCGLDPNDQRFHPMYSTQFFRIQIDLTSYVSQIEFVLDDNNIEKTITLPERETLL